MCTGIARWTVAISADGCLVNGTYHKKRVTFASPERRCPNRRREASIGRLSALAITETVEERPGEVWADIALGAPEEIAARCNAPIEAAVEGSACHVLRLRAVCCRVLADAKDIVCRMGDAAANVRRGRPRGDGGICQVKGNTSALKQ
jgi:hypothetical protein